jgi:putative phosphoribosyl transferase
MRFRARHEAGQRLATRLSVYKDQHPVILALPRGGLPVGAVIAEALGAPLDLILVRKIGVPWHEELAMGAVAGGAAPIVIRNEDVIGMTGVSASDFERVCAGQLAEIERRRKLYLGSRTRAEIAGRTAIVVDDGIATGATMRAALQATRARAPAKLVLAVPVGPPDTIADLRGEADEVICLEEHFFFGAIGMHYDDFRQVTDDEVVEFLARHPVSKAEAEKAPAV